MLLARVSVRISAQIIKAGRLVFGSLLSNRQSKCNAFRELAAATGFNGFFENIEFATVEPSAVTRGALVSDDIQNDNLIHFVLTYGTRPYSITLGFDFGFTLVTSWYSF